MRAPGLRLESAMKIIHTADWQLGKPFARFEPDVRAALTEARFDAIDAIGRYAQAHEIDHVLVAGDIFDTEGPEDRTVVQALSRMERHPCRWWLLPGNHDFARNGGLWDRVKRRAGTNIISLTESEPCELEDGIWLLPAPLAHRHNMDDPTDLFDQMETPGARLRIGLAHGSIRDFGSQGETKNQIAIDRAQRSKLDYLALGDWHGALKVDSRTWYSGTPETDRFQRDEPGQILVVDLEPGAEPAVTTVRTGRFQWLRRTWSVSTLADFEADCTELAASIDPASTLLELSLSGITSLSDRVAVMEQVENDLRHQLRYLDLRDGDLVGRPSDDDLAALTVEGILGVAAAKLSERIDAGGSDAPIARRALERLFVEYARENRP